LTKDQAIPPLKIVIDREVNALTEIITASTKVLLLLKIIFLI
jgi:hypothetical protein